jgi:hypothetical protein
MRRHSYTPVRVDDCFQSLLFHSADVNFIPLLNRIQFIFYFNVIYIFTGTYGLKLIRSVECYSLYKQISKLILYWCYKYESIIFYLGYSIQKSTSKFIIYYENFNRELQVAIHYLFEISLRNSIHLLLG